MRWLNSFAIRYSWDHREDAPTTYLQAHALPPVTSVISMCAALQQSFRSHRHALAGENLLAALDAGESVAAPIIAVVAHPDDEIIGMGSRISGLKNLTLLHVTNGAPANMRYARSLGFDSTESFSRARFDESRRALTIVGAKPSRQTTFGYPDGDTVFHLRALVEQLARAMAGAAAVITHAYEGGHPDHDSCALAVQLACARITADGGLPPRRLEFAGYHRSRGQLAVNCFWANLDFPETLVSLSWRERWIKRRALRAFATQPFILQKFVSAREAYRFAPSYDFLAPPPPEECHYDCRDWGLKSENWLAHVHATFSEAGVRRALRGLTTSV